MAIKKDGATCSEGPARIVGNRIDRSNHFRYLSMDSKNNCIILEMEGLSSHS